MRHLAVLVLALAACADHHGTTTVDGPPGAIDAPVAIDAPATPDAPMVAHCTNGPYAYCDDFESYPAAALANNQTLGNWSVQISAVTFAIDATGGYHHTHALRVTVPAHVNSGTGGTPSHGILNQKAPGGIVASNNLFGRVMIYYSNTNGNGLPIGVHSWYFDATGTSSAINMPVGINQGGGGTKLQLNYHPGDLSVDNGTMTAGAWHCIQWQYDGSGSPSANLANVWIDGVVAIPSSQVTGWNFATPWDAFALGFTHYQTLNNTVDVFLDDFALDGTKVPCPT